jgi:hypothetical protein
MNANEHEWGAGEGCVVGLARTAWKAIPPVCRAFGARVVRRAAP